MRAAKLSNISERGQVGVQRNRELHARKSVCHSEAEKWVCRETVLCDSTTVPQALSIETRALPLPHLPGSVFYPQIIAPHTF